MFAFLPREIAPHKGIVVAHNFQWGFFWKFPEPNRTKSVFKSKTK